MNQLSQEVLNRLDALAAKLGTTVAQLWAVLIVQARVEAWSDVVFGVVFVALAFWAIKVLRSAITSLSKADPYVRWSNGDAIRFWLSLVGSLAFGVMATFTISDAITPMLNPQYWALQEILKAFK